MTWTRQWQESSDMCGIAGAYSNAAKSSGAEIDLSSVLSRLARRGPDGQGVSRGRGWVLGHRRLAIIDINGGSQPYEDRSGCVISYNGELYNYRDLREELRAAGQVFATRSDTEVVLKAWMAWGPNCLTRFNGMFAFAIYDSQRDSLFLARDHLGIKPLFYHVGQDDFHFASSMAALLAFKDIPAVADPVGISHYLATTHIVMGARTLVKGVRSLEPGTWIEVKRGFVDKPPQPVRYWLPPDQLSNSMSFESAAARTRELVHDSLCRQLVSDVPVGGFLSGGIDSTIITSQATRLSEHSFRTYSAGYQEESFAGESYNEWSYVREAVSLYGIKSKEIILKGSDFHEDWKFLIAEKGQPLSTPNEVGIYRLAMALREDCTVALSGEGAVFGGYTEVLSSVMDFERAQQQSQMAIGVREADAAALKRKYGVDHFNSLLDHYLRVFTLLKSETKFGLLRPEWKEVLKGDEALLLYHHERLDAMKDLTPFNAYSRLLLEKNLQSLLFRLDSSTMAASVEGRVPFTDPRLVSLLSSLLDHYKVVFSKETGDAGLGKLLLRAAFADTVPANILARRKMSFAVPFRQWFAGPLRDLVESNLRENPWAKAWLQTQSVDFILTNLDEPAYGIMIWPLVNLCLWQEAMGISWEPNVTS
jgi:asparagine synthase (glutamine-hydrolysing)